MLNQTNVVPTQFASTPLTMPIQSQIPIQTTMPIQSQVIQPGLQTIPLQSVQQVLPKTSVIPEYGQGVATLSTVPVASTIPVQTSVPLTTTVPVQQSTVISTQPQTKYR